jgi:hypothetical protein
VKLRIKGNAIRLRLGQSEVRRLVIDGTVEEITVFGPSKQQRLSYALCVSPEAHEVSASFTDRRILLRVPRSVIDSWARTDQISIVALQRIGDEGELRILIEKDFECIEAPPDESQEDAFPRQPVGAACGVAKAIER